MLLCVEGEVSLAFLTLSALRLLVVLGSPCTGPTQGRGANPPSLVRGWGQLSALPLHQIPLAWIYSVRHEPQLVSFAQLGALGTCCGPHVVSAGMLDVYSQPAGRAGEMQLRDLSLSSSSLSPVPPGAGGLDTSDSKAPTLTCTDTQRNKRAYTYN